MRTYLWLVLLAPLAACSFAMPVTDADENGGTVNLVTNPYGTGAALKAAQHHCDQYHRRARMLQSDQASNSMTFSCYDPNQPVFEGPARP